MGSAFPQLCEAGFYCNRTGLHTPAGHCAAGYYCPQGSLDPHATLCPAGHYCPLGTLFPLPCPLGTMKSEIWFFFHTFITKISGRGGDGYHWHTNSLFLFCFVNELIRKQLDSCCWTQIQHLQSFFSLQHCDTHLRHSLKFGNGNLSVIEAFIFPSVCKNNFRHMVVYLHNCILVLRQKPRIILEFSSSCVCLWIVICTVCSWGWGKYFTISTNAFDQTWCLRTHSGFKV